MKFILKPLSFLTLILLFGLFSVQTVFADTVTLSGSVKDSSGNAISGATINVNDANADSTTTDSSGDYSIVIPNGEYDIQVTPPAGSEFSSAIALSQDLSSNTTLNFILSPAGTVILKGQVYGPQGNLLPNQKVSLIGSGGNPVATSTTDANGNYSIQTSPGTYSKLDINVSTGSGNAPSLNVPQYYDIYVTNYTLTQSTLLDITIPAKKASVHVQDASNNAVSNVQLDATTPNDSNSG
jgi:hypothetical protein